MAKRLLLLRHASIGLDLAGRLVGASDPDLDAPGRSQARALADRIRTLAPARCYCSPARRCRQTAELLALDVPAEEDADLREIDFGSWEGRSFAEAAAAAPELAARFAGFDLDFAFPGGESLKHFFTRVHAVADRLAQEDTETLLVVTHGGVIRAMLCRLLGLNLRKYVLFDVGYAALVVVNVFDGRGVLVLDSVCGTGPVPLSASLESGQRSTKAAQGLCGIPSEGPCDG